jgi:hypothetical protein
MLSVAWIVHETEAPPGPVASTGLGLGTVVNVGGWLSTRSTTTLKSTPAVLPRPSSAEQCTGVEPIGKLDPGAGAQVTVKVCPRSVALGAT